MEGIVPVTVISFMFTLSKMFFFFFRQLIGQCRRASLPALIPSGTCLSSPGDVLFDLLLGHRDVITALTVTTDGQRVITASKDETIKVIEFKIVY